MLIEAARAATLLLALAGLALAALWLWQDRLIYFPDRARPDAPPGVTALTLRTADGLDLLAWWQPPASPGQPVLLYLHGNGGHIGYRAERLRAFAARGWGVLMPAYRGYAGNPGRPSEAGLALDAHAALAWLGAQGVAPRRIALWGESLGSGVAVRLAAGTPGRVGALLLEAPYTSLLDLARLHHPLLPARWLLRDRYDSLARIGAVGVPVLVMIGGRDVLIPPAMSRRLAAAARPPVEVWEAPLAGHDELRAHGAIEAAAAFLDRAAQSIR
ncbi:MAG: alpha/beta hydrolase [Acetobacteraceae bacterium]|nr:alpha/beta hydrolase [Acetobacteraceae bacterium]